MPAVPAPSHPACATVLTLAVGAAGGLAFSAVSAPAAFLTGSLVAVTAAVLLNAPTHLPEPLRMAAFCILGVTMGAGIEPEALRDVSALPLAFAGLLLVVAAATGASYAMLRRVGRWDRLSAFLGSVPGSFSVVLAVALERGARMERVVTAQVLRLLVLVAVVPFAFGGGAAVRAVGPADAGPVRTAVTVAIAALAVVLARGVRLPVPAMLGPLVASAALSASGVFVVAVPGWLSAGAFVVLGAAVGVRLTGVRREGLRRMLLASLASFAAAFTVAISAALVLAPRIGEPVGEVFLAYAPGGLDAMIALSFLLGFDVAFVAILHVTRVVLLAFATPIGAALLSRSADARADRSGGADEVGDPAGEGGPAAPGGALVRPRLPAGDRR